MEHKNKLSELITALINQNGSDIHLATGRKPAMRIAGQLIFLSNAEVYTKEDMEGILEELVGKEKAKLFMEKQESDFAYSLGDTVRLRGNAFFQKGFMSIALRLIPKNQTIAELHLPPIIETFARKQQGFFLVVGPVGQGKSTTMSSMIDLINKERATHIITVEDPIEFVHTSMQSIVDQREVGIDTKDFNSALTSIFREDANVIMIGEMRNAETIATAVTAAETGHLVISTLHTNTASQTIERIIDSFPGEQQDQIRVQLAGSLLGIFSQRLVPRISGGRIPAYELLINNSAVSNLIREKRTHEIDVVIETSFAEGMIDMNRSLIELVRAGEISMESAYQYSYNPKGLEQLL
jgi:twitching motility protein PilT